MDLLVYRFISLKFMIAAVAGKASLDLRYAHINTIHAKIYHPESKLVCHGSNSSINSAKNLVDSSRQSTFLQLTHIQRKIGQILAIIRFFNETSGYD